MIRTVSIVPTILTDNKQDYRAQAERINIFTRRVQIDVTDGIFAPTQTLDITNVWWPKNWEADLHLMVANPSEHLDTVLKLNPSLCILHAEANEDLLPSFQILKDAGIKTGVALLPSTFPGKCQTLYRCCRSCVDFCWAIGGTRFTRRFNADGKDSINS